MLTTPTPKGIADLEPVVSDSLLALIGLIAADPRTDKIDVGVGVFRDGAGTTPIPASVKEAERRLVANQETKAYLGGWGDRGFTAALRPIVLGGHAGDARIAGVQTPGGCGALFLATRLIKLARPEARVLVGTPTWPNHPPLLKGAGLETVEYRHYDFEARRIDFEALRRAAEQANVGDVLLLHGCCHNPTGADLGEEQWREVAAIASERRLTPLIDLAYQGFGRGLDEDAYGVRVMLDACDEVLIAQSCDKNFGVYRDRVGSMWLKTGSEQATANAMAHVLQIAREAWSMPPDHGAATARIVLEDSGLRQQWLGEVAAMRDRINAVRRRIADSDPRLAYIANEFGMFSMMPLSKAQVVGLREKHGIYMADSGRFNVVGMADADIDRFCAAVVEALDG
ncbi:aromatic amino acid transaminase [Sphingomonas sp. BN140010]|uniref:Aromatic amino acid transaminase n=1 Tax=Sphingomonas arvum TaxID=2992113 RepID=A0ABT3JCQ9_9SPHN|nr:aromatic amino acid transaminase [Sphingomonas sp. BN140010]MCW3796858.1 aromatic amino acid transaminase [Sphingomonas sp. BN140010]